MTLIVEQYIRENKVTEADTLIFRNYKEFLQILYENSGRVDMIVWYEYCRINEQKMGMGGYIDPVNKGYMWAETQLFETDLRNKEINEILDYISDIRSQYRGYDLYPEFYLET